MLDGIIAFDLFIGMPPQLGLDDPGLGEIARLFQIQLDDAGANVGAAYIHSKDALVALEHPRGQEMSGAEQSGFVRVAADKLEIDIDIVSLQQKACPGHGKLTDPAAAEPATDDETFRIAPTLETHKAAYDQSELLRKVLNGTLHNPRGFGFAVCQ